MFGLAATVTHANSPAVRCHLDYATSSLGGRHETTFNDVGSLSVQDCIEMAIEARNSSIGPVQFKYTHYTKIVGENVDIGSEGWSVSGEISTPSVKPQRLDYAEFVNP